MITSKHKIACSNDHVFVNVIFDLPRAVRPHVASAHNKIWSLMYIYTSAYICFMRYLCTYMILSPRPTKQKFVHNISPQVAIIKMANFGNGYILVDL